MQPLAPPHPNTLTYCTNIHPARGLSAVRQSLDAISVPLKSRLSPGETFPLGLRLSGDESRQLDAPGALDAFNDWLAQRGLSVACLNGFPFGPFHTERVKDTVHTPDWSTIERVAYTLRLAKILAELTPPGASAGISTSPLSYKPWGEPTRQKRTLMTRHIAHVACELAALSRKADIDLHLDIEPEPDGVLETAVEFASWFTNELEPIAAPLLQKNLDLSAASAADELRRRIAVCLDACHSAIEFETPAEALNTYESAGVRIGRVQVSSALCATASSSPDARGALRRSLEPYAESIYLHQVVARRPDGSLVRWPDLPDALDDLDITADAADTSEWRIHFHVPVFADSASIGDHRLATTQRHTHELISLVQARSMCDLFEVETYTWSVLPAPLRLDLVDSIERELRWLRNEFSSSQTKERP